MHRTRTFLLFCVTALTLCTSACARAEEPAVRTQFTQALQKIDSGTLDGDDSKALRAYVLYPYLQAARLRARVQRSNKGEADADANAFLETNGTDAATRELRRDWLQSLAQRNEWTTYRVAYREAQADTDQRCQNLLARIKTADAALKKDEALALWMSGQTQPSTCIPAFDWMTQQGWITDVERAQRARLALQAGNTDLAASLIKDIHTPEAVAPLQQWLQLIRTPQVALQQVVDEPKTRIETAALLDGFTRLARKNPDAAQALYQPVLKAQKLTPKESGAFSAALAMGYVLGRQPEAMTYFRKTPEAALDDKSHEWRVRAAIWNGDWDDAARWTQQMPAALAQSDRWRYWHARALAQSAKTKAKAQTLYRELARKNNVYAVWAAQRIGEVHTPQPQPSLVNPALQTALQKNPAITRAYELFSLGLNDWAKQEWQQALGNSSNAQREQAGLMAASWGWNAQAIPTLASASVYDDFKVTYPLQYETFVEAAAKRAELPPSWLYGVMRQESLYDARALSSAKAYGLLQLLLSTARKVAQQWQLDEPSREDLFDPQINLTLGAAYLHDLIRDWNGSLVLALGSYNAGPNAVKRWLPSTPKDADVWIENIPYGETRSYIQRILWHVSVFGWKETGKPQDLSDQFKPISKSAS